MQIKDTDRFNFSKITGLACKTNKTLSFLAMDSLTYELVSERLGIKLNSSNQNTAAVIIDSQVCILIFSIFFARTLV